MVTLKRNISILAVLLSGLAAVWGLLAMFGRIPSRVFAQEADDYGTYYVDLDGNCGGEIPCYISIQEAVDAVDDPSDVIKVAAGIYTGVRNIPVLNTSSITATQMLAITKSLAIRGGYTVTNWTSSSLADNPTVLDAQNQGRVIYVTGNVTATIEELQIVGGDAMGLGPNWPFRFDCGGGVLVENATMTIRNSRIADNSGEYGGGLCLWYSDSEITGITIVSNAVERKGGGFYSHYSSLTLSDSFVISNSAGLSGGGGGLWESETILARNVISANVVTESGGGGLAIEVSEAHVSTNTIALNRSPFGGGLSVWASNARVDDNLVISNTGGGVHVSGWGPGGEVIFVQNDIIANSTSWAGGGIHIRDWYGDSVPVFIGNQVISNTSGRYGGGIYATNGSGIFVNNVVANNTSTESGGGIYAEGSSLQFLHTTIVDNKSDSGYGEAIYLQGGQVDVSNTIVASHTIAVLIDQGTAKLDHILWYDNSRDWLSWSSTITHSDDYYGDPGFVHPSMRDFHIRKTSLARDAAVKAGVVTDIDGDARPRGHGNDIGADEYPAPLSVVMQAIPSLVGSGMQLTYTIQVTNYGSISLTPVVTVCLSEHVLPTGTITLPLDMLVSGDDWVQTIVVTVDREYSGTLESTVQVETLEGATGGDREISSAILYHRVYLPVVLRDD